MKIRYFWELVKARPRGVKVLYLLCTVITLHHAVALLLGHGPLAFRLLGLLAGAGMAVLIIARWWPPLCPCGERHWDLDEGEGHNGGDQDDQDDEGWGLAA